MAGLHLRQAAVIRYSKERVKVKLTSSSSGSLVTRCMGRMRKEIMGRPPHSLLPSICFRVSLNAVLLVLSDRKKEGSSAHPAVTAATRQLVTVSCRYSQQPLQRPLLERLVGAVDDVGLEVVSGVVLNNIANVPDHWVVIVTPFEILKKPDNGEGEVSEDVKRLFPPTHWLAEQDTHSCVRVCPS